MFFYTFMPKLFNMSLTASVVSQTACSVVK